MVSDLTDLSCHENLWIPHISPSQLNWLLCYCKSVSAWLLGFSRAVFFRAFFRAFFAIKSQKLKRSGFYDVISKKWIGDDVPGSNFKSTLDPWKLLQSVCNGFRIKGFVKVRFISNYFYDYLLRVGIYLIKSMSYEIIKCSSHAFTNPESTIFFTEFSLFCFSTR